MSVFGFTDEQLALREAVRSFATDAITEAELRRMIDTPAGHDVALWQRLSDQLGLTGLVVPERFGGAGADGGGIVELAIALDELGRVLYPGPLLSTALATLAIVESGDEAAQADLLPGLAAGTTIATPAIAETGPAGSGGNPWSATAVHTTAEPTVSGWALTGQKRYVTDAQVADLFVVAARTPGGVGLFAVPMDPSVTVTSVSGFDITRRLATVSLAGSPGRLLGELGDGPALLARFLDLAAVLTSAEAVGGAQAALDLAVGYAKERVQFGRVIGSFQAIKHLCADTLLDVESARSAAYYAAWTAAERSADRPGELTRVAALAKAFCADVYLDTATANMQIHGGISFTWESACHLYYRRAKASRQLWGAPSVHRERLAGALLDDRILEGASR